MGDSIGRHPRRRAYPTASTSSAGRHAGVRRGIRDQPPRPHLATGPAMRRRPHLARGHHALQESGEVAPGHPLAQRGGAQVVREPGPGARGGHRRRRQRGGARVRCEAQSGPGHRSHDGRAARGAPEVSSGARSSTRATSRSTGCRSASRTGSYPSRREAHQGGARTPGAHPRPGLFSLITALRMSNTRDLTGAKIDLEDAYACVPSSHYLYPKPGLTDCVRTWHW